jgi:hypothetical protein
MTAQFRTLAELTFNEPNEVDYTGDNINLRTLDEQDEDE